MEQQKFEIAIGKQYITRSGIITPPIEASNDRTNYRFGAWIDEPEFPTSSYRSWLKSGSFLSNTIDHPLDLVEEYTEAFDAIKNSEMDLTLDQIIYDHI